MPGSLDSELLHAGAKRGLVQSEAPEGQENNWVQTVPGKGWNTIFRLYGPLEPWYDKTWRLGEIELVK